ncbi:Protein of unknown function DUF1645 [Theobroma cacao]|nr:Protein of unknown function DUF1645 [Theobroma cacao]
MSMTPQTPNDSFYMSAPASPRRISLEGLCFYSVPTSSTRKTLKAAYDLDTEPTTPRTFEDSNSNVDEFEFETRRRFNVDEYGFESEPKSESKLEDPQENHVRKESLPAMAFADELFSGGKVMPLKPPPRLQYANDNKYDKQSSTLSSPRSPTGVLKLPFQRRSLWNDDFDPFMVALENVKEEKVEKSQAKNRRRARSMSPFREIIPKGTYDLSGSSQQQINQMGLILPTQQLKPNLNKRMESNDSAFLMWVPDQNRQMGRQEQLKQVKKTPIQLAEPKGVLFARRARLVKMGHENPRKTNVINPTVEEGESANASGETCTKETNSQKFKKFLFRSGSVRKISNEEKPKSSNATESKPNITRKFSFKSMGLTQYNEEKGVSQVTRMTLVQYRPKLLLCMGYGAKYVQ